MSDTLNKKQIDKANQLLKEGKINEAKNRYLNILNDNANNEIALKNLTIIFLKQNRFVEALKNYEILFNNFERSAEIYNNYGYILKKNGNTIKALKIFKEGYDKFPSFADLLINYSALLNENGQYEQVIDILNKINNDFKNSDGIYLNLANAYVKKKLFLDAEENYNKALEINPKNLGIYFNFANLFRLKKEYKKSINYYEKILEKSPNNFYALNNRCLVKKEMKNYQSAIQDFKYLINLNTNLSYIAIFNLGDLYLEINKFKLAYNCYKKSIKLRPNYFPALVNISNILFDLEKYKWAKNLYDKAINFAYKTNNKDKINQIKYNRSLLLLKNGDYKNGWKDYEFRWFSKSFINRYNKIFDPYWKKDNNIANKTLLIFNEMGLGDEIHFSMFVPELLKKNINVIFQVSNPLYELYKNFHSKIKVIKQNDLLPKFDFSISIMSLPYYLDLDKNNFPRPKKFLFADKKKVSLCNNKLSKSKLKIGFVYSGSNKNPSNKFREINIKKFSKLFTKNEDCDFFNLSNDNSTEDIAYLKNFKNVYVYSKNEMNFENTASLCMNLNLVITVDTSIAHLSGALGVKTWILLSKNSDWRWLISKKDNIWYENVQLFRQKKLFQWEIVLNEIMQSLIIEKQNLQKR